jgi:murein DD-endopeptidase MepM/ murein hydrolase activator NlpD
LLRGIVLKDKNIIILSIIFLLLIIFIYIFYLNFIISDLKNDLKSKENLYSIQINNRIDEILELSEQIKELHRIMDVGLVLNSNDKIVFNNKIDENSLNNLFKIIPNGFPLIDVQVSSRFGERIHPISNIEKFHSGLDLKTKIGNNVYSTASGVVYKVRNEDNGGYGKFVTILHAFGFTTLYAHLDEVLVKEGDFVDKNSVIATSGNTGISTGPHLHYEIKFLEKHLNPIDFIYWNKKSFNSIFMNNSNIEWKNLINKF